MGDVAWAPYSSTVFAAVTFEGKVYIYDLSVNKYNPICVQVNKTMTRSSMKRLKYRPKYVQTIVSKKQGVLNHIAFNREEPVIVVGDSRGHVHSLKLSPNLRKRSKEAQAAVRNKERKKFLEMETRKLDQIVNQVMEPLARRDTDSDPEQ